MDRGQFCRDVPEIKGESFLRAACMRVVISVAFTAGTFKGHAVRLILSLD
jgi:hypothetical protein